MIATDEEFFDENGFKFLRYIGRGAYGYIFLVCSEQYQENFVVKRVKETVFNRAEIDCMQEINHPNIVNLYQYYFYKGFVYLVMEYCPTSVDQELTRNKDFVARNFQKLVTEMALSIQACHEHHISHQDIKPSNFLIDKYRRIKLCDFGLSSLHKDDDNVSSNYVGSIIFTAPEVLMKHPYDSYKADIWSFGVTLYLMATGMYPWDTSSNEAATQSILAGVANFDIIQDEKTKNVIRSCLQLDPKLRPNIDQLLNFPFFQRPSSFYQSKNSVSHEKFLRRKGIKSTPISSQIRFQHSLPIFRPVLKKNKRFDTNN